MLVWKQLYILQLLTEIPSVYFVPPMSLSFCTHTPPPPPPILQSPILIKPKTIYHIRRLKCLHCCLRASIGEHDLRARNKMSSAAQHVTVTGSWVKVQASGSTEWRFMNSESEFYWRFDLKHHVHVQEYVCFWSLQTSVLFKKVFSFSKYVGFCVQFVDKCCYLGNCKIGLITLM